MNTQTIRMVARSSLAGENVRIRLYNAIGAEPVFVGAASIALRATGSGVIAGTNRRLTFGGRSSVALEAGQTIVSDPVSLHVPALADIAVSIFVDGEITRLTGHLFGLRPSYFATGDHTAAATLPSSDSTQSYYWLAGIDVLASADAGVLVGFGDSITDGDQSTPDRNRSWPALLAERLQGLPPTRRVGVVNAGIAGNRLLAPDNGGLARLMHDALTVPSVRWITLLEGINDITSESIPGREPLTAEDLIFGYRQVIELAHQQGVKVIGCTITPMGGSSVYTDAREAIRTQVNAWIRTSGEFDAVVDFDAAVRDPGNPSRFRPEAESPDLLHPGDGGYRLMADAFDLNLFATAR